MPDRAAEKLVWLDQVGPRDRPRVGGKAMGLARLAQAGLPVPPAVVLTTGAQEAFLRANGLWERVRHEPGPELAEVVRAGRLDPALAGRLRTVAGRLGPLLAVRSSAVDEDAADASHAGQYRTVLGVRPGDETERAVLDCWASTWSERAVAYARAHGGGERAGPRLMAVVIQALVEPRCAGVMFTVNPASGSWREMTVEAAWGFGEAVVDGRIVPDFYRVRRPRRAPRPVQRLLARVRLDVVESQVRRQEDQWVVGEGRTRPSPLPEELRRQPKLVEAQLKRLCRLGLRAEGLLGGPQDVEWALDHQGRFSVLQSRPVTTARDVRRGGGPVVWTRRFVGERWTEPATPLGWSEMRDLLDWFIAYPATSRRYLGGKEPTRLHRFAPYLNVTVFRHLAFKAPGAPPPRFMVELLPPDEERGWLRRHAEAPDLRVYWSILGETLRERRWQRFRWNPLTNWRAWQAFEGGLDAALAAIPDGPRDRAEARRAVEACRALARDYVKVHICSLLFANIWYQLAEAALAAEGRGQAAATLLRSPAENWTVRTNDALRRLGLGECSLEAFLLEFGHRSSSSWELFAPRWAEVPDHVQALARAAATAPEPARTEDAQTTLASLSLPTRSLVRLTRRYLLLREDQRFHFDRLLWRWKRALLFLEADLGLELRFLENTEVDGLLDGDLDRRRAEDLVARRRSAWRDEVARRAAGDEPPAFLVGDEAQALLPQGQRLQGMGISAGVATGPVRVIRTLDQAARLRPGDILVTRATDPGWTPLFLRAGGLVMEQGGMLSHGAVVAREYRLPAVVNVSGATSVLQDGQAVTVDGGSGVVWIR